MDDKVLNSTFFNFIKRIYSNVMPQGAGALFCIQTVSTLSFSVIYSTLVLYLTNGLHLNDSTSTGITASFVAFNYALHLLGGYIGGRYLSYRMLFCFGMICQVVGCLLLSIVSIDYFYWGLAVFLSGCGLNVTCINCMLTQLFKPDDKRRESAFLWNYSGMNIGFFIGFSISGYFQLLNNYSVLFVVSSIGNILALFIIAMKWSQLGDIKTHLMTLSVKARRHANINGIFFIVTLIFALRWVLEHSRLSNHLIMVVGFAMALVILYFAFRQPTPEEKNKVLAYLILAFTSLVFWTLYQLGPMGLTLFIERNVDRHYLGFLIAPQWVQNINTIVIILGGPILSHLFISWRNKGFNLTLPIQFSIALVLIGAAFAILPIGIHFSNSQGYVNFNWVIASFILQSLGELFISPIGYAMVGQLAPQKLQGVMMGTWLMITGVSATFSGYFSTKALGVIQTFNPLTTNATFSETFNLLGWSAIGTGAVLFFLIPFVLRLTQERKIFPKNECLDVK